MVRCKECGDSFESKFQMKDTSIWHKPNALSEISMECPGCGKNLTYEKLDHFFK